MRLLVLSATTGADLTKLIFSKNASPNSKSSSPPWRLSKTHERNEPPDRRLVKSRSWAQSRTVRLLPTSHNAADHTHPLGNLNQGTERWFSKDPLRDGA